MTTVPALPALALIATLAGAPPAGAAPARPSPVLKPLPATPASQPFAAASRQVKPISLADYGYGEEEYLLSGVGKVFDWPAGWKPGMSPAVAAEGPYTTRILVRRPKDPRRWSGAAVVEPFNASVNVDIPIMWAESYEHFLREGHAWIGVSIKPNTLAALKRFDPQRYQGLSMANPRTSPCSEETIRQNSMFSSTPLLATDEIGLGWEALSDVARVLKSRGPANPLGAPAARVYMTGQSQSASHAKTYASIFGPVERGPDGKPLYDGYLYSGGAAWVPLNQCAPALPPGLASPATLPAGAPVIEMLAEGDVLTGLTARRPDGDRAPDLFRRYEVAGSSHVDLWEDGGRPDAADMARAGRSSSQELDTCTPKDVKPGDFPVRYAFNAGWASLDRWARGGPAAPHAEPIRVRDPKADPEKAFDRDGVGNARGGVRLPTLSVPRSQWVGSKSGGFGCSFRGYERPLSATDLKSLYPSNQAYLARLRAAVRKAVAGRWLTRADGDSLIAQASGLDD